MKYDMVFEGGGAKGMLFVGAMKAVEEMGHEPGRVLGTSAGAITACLLAAGYTSAEMAAALGEKMDGKSVFVKFAGAPGPFGEADVQQSALLALFKKGNLPFVPDVWEERVKVGMANWMATQSTLSHLFSFIERGGWYSADYFVEWLERLLNTGSYKNQPRRFAKMTLAQFYEATQVDVSLIASDITGGQMLILNHRTAPGVPLAWAVRMSMSIPLLWQEVVWSSAWGPYRGMDIKGHSIVDGGLLSNFPVELLVSHDASVKAVMGPEVSHNLLGCLLDETMPVPGIKIEKPSPGEFRVGDLKTVRRLGDLLNTMLGARDKSVMDALCDFVLRLPAGGVSTTEFDMNDEKRAALLEAGYQAAKAHLEEAESRADVSFGLGEEERIHPRLRALSTKGALRALGG